MRGHVSPAFSAVTSHSCKINTTVFVILLQLLRELELDDTIVVIIQVKDQKVLLIRKIHFMHLRQYDEKYFVYLAIIRRHSEKSRRKRDHACAA